MRSRRWCLVVGALLVGTCRGAVVDLPAADARVHGTTLRYLVLEGLGNLCYWTQPSDWAEWSLTLPAAGTYVVDLRLACRNGAEGSRFAVAVGDQQVAGTVPRTGTWYDHADLTVGRLTLPAGPTTLSLKPLSKPGEAVMNLNGIRLIPLAEEPTYRSRRRAELARAASELAARADTPVRILANFHPASCGWLADFSTERNYCAYSYLAHLDKVKADPTYRFELSEVNNQMAILAFEPARFEELRQRVREKRVELANGFFLEPTISLSGGEALVRMGLEGIKWQQQVVGATPRAAWCIDVCGVHEQMAQIVAGLGLEALVYTRDNPTSQTLHWFESPDGTRTLAISPGHYSEWGQLFASPKPLAAGEVKALVADAAARLRTTPPQTPIVILGGNGDYSLPPACPQYPHDFIEQWHAANHNRELTFGSLADVLDPVLRTQRWPKLELSVVRGGTRYSWTSFWFETPEVKQRYRRAEHALQAAEMAATAASLAGSYSYPSARLRDGWLQLLLNMDRNTLWGAAGGMVFESRRSWDAKDRFDWVDRQAALTAGQSLDRLYGSGTGLALFNPVNASRQETCALQLPPEQHLADVDQQPDGSGRTLCRLALPSLGSASVALLPGAPPPPTAVPLPAVIEMPAYRAVVEPRSGALVSLRLKPTDRELLAAPVQLVAEVAGDYHNTPLRPQRRRLGDSREAEAQVVASVGPLATVVEARGRLLGQALRTRWVFYRDTARIDAEVELNDVPTRTVVLAELPLAGSVVAARRGIPYGFSQAGAGGVNRDLTGFAEGIMPAIEWSDYALAEGGGVALLDRGLPGRELTGNTPTLLLLNAHESYMGYPCPWLSGKGKHRYEFALLPHVGSFAEARVPQTAWAYNSPPLVLSGATAGAPTSYLTTSDNVLVESLRRDERAIELRLVECTGQPGTATVTLNLPHRGCARTDFGRNKAVRLTGGPTYSFPVRPQQIVTLVFLADTGVVEPEPRRKWDDLVPPQKLPALLERLPGRTGHPPEGGVRDE